MKPVVSRRWVRHRSGLDRGGTPWEFEGLLGGIQGVASPVPRVGGEIRGGGTVDSGEGRRWSIKGGTGGEILDQASVSEKDVSAVHRVSEQERGLEGAGVQRCCWTDGGSGGTWWHEVEVGCFRRRFRAPSSTGKEGADAPLNPRGREQEGWEGALEVRAAGVSCRECAACRRCWRRLRVGRRAVGIRFREEWVCQEQV
jgi:hypothetical protein